MEASQPAPEEALRALAGKVEAEGEPLASAASPDLPEPALGPLAASGPLTAANPSAYSFVVEAVREGYACHFTSPRLLEAADPDLLLLAGDLFYAYGISTLAQLGDDRAVGLLSDLIRISGELHAAGRGADADELWLAQVLAVAFGSDDDLVEATSALRAGSPGAAERLGTWSTRTAGRAGAGRRIGEVREVLHFGSAGLDFP
jgi:hypothetical protein